jgi:hypothetical protein
MGDPFTGDGIDAVGVNELFDMTPLLGSTEANQFRLATERVVTYDASAAMTNNDLEALPVVSANGPAFLAAPGTSTFRAQTHFTLLSNAFARTDMLMAGKWESVLPLSGIQSVIPPAEFAPRAIVFTDISSDLRCSDAPACVNPLSVAFKPSGQVPVEFQQPLDTQPFEVVAEMGLKNSNNIPLVLHEFGHVIDLFAHAGIINRGTHCTGKPDCAASCDEDTTDEATPLKETFASLAAIWLGHELTAVGQDATNCSYLTAVARGENRSPHNDTCRPDGIPFARLIRDDDPSCPSTFVCDKPSSPGFEFDEETSALIPTGACFEGGVTGGYQVSSMFQPFWEALHGQSCSETPPFLCQPQTELAGSSGDILGGALLYAVRMNSMTYKSFVGDMATYIACNFGDTAYFQFNKIACHHDLRDCDAGVPITCEFCGDNERQVGEACDGADLGGSTCETEGFAGGVLLCNEMCEFDISMCTNTGTEDDSGAPTSGPISESTPTEGFTSGPAPTSGDTIGAMTEQSSTTTVPDDGGCDCRHNTRSVTWPAWLLAGGLLSRRRRPGKPGLAAALGWCLFMLPGAGCSVKDDSSTHDETSAEATSEEPASTTAGETTSSDLPDLRRLYGAFHEAEYTDGIKWEQPPFDEDIMYLTWWSNVVIEADSTLRNEYYYCGGPPEVQEFTWEPDGDGIRVVPPGGEGTSFTWSAAEVSEVSIRPGELCGEVIVVVRATGSDEPFPSQQFVAGHLCTKNVSLTECEFEFTWCDGPPEPPVCE